MNMPKVVIISLLLAFSLVLGAVPPHPLVESDYSPTHEFRSEHSFRTSGLQPVNVPDSILVLRAEFEDVKFISEPTYPDSIPRDKAYFERLMFHLASYYHDASHGKYRMITETDTLYTVWDNVFTAPNTMGYYGYTPERLTRVCEFAQDVIMLADQEIDFHNYDSVIIFHAGAGAESDVNSANPDQIQSTFLTRRALQAGLDPENDDFPGIVTSDGKVIREIAIMPETQWQPDFVPGEDPIFGMLGVASHLFGRFHGFPSLTYTGSPYVPGAGNFCVMGSGLWNANGFVPPLPSAWLRYYVGWEEDNIVTIDSVTTDNQIVFPMADDELTPKLYKIPFSDKEYYLIENRQQNPDNSTHNGEPTFTFQLLPEGEQEYYPPGHPNEGQPRFNFMKNTYLGCEWDFFSPGLGGPDPEPIDGSGLLIWHVDENVIEDKFNPYFEKNHINSDPNHKGVDLKEADGIQHMDSRSGSMYDYGSPYDAYRADNNTYLGKLVDPLTGSISIPMAGSHYGGIPFEIYDISQSDSLMTFSVNFEWTLDSRFQGESPYSPAIVDFNRDGSNEIVTIYPNGKIVVWKHNNMYTPPFTINKITQYYAYDEHSGTFYLPTENTVFGYSRLFVLNHQQYFYMDPLADKSWATHPVVHPDSESQYHLFLPFNTSDGYGEIYVMDKDLEILQDFTLDTKIISNLILSEQENNISFVCADTNGQAYLSSLYFDDQTETHYPLDMEVYPEFFAAAVDISANGEYEYIISAEERIFAFDSEGNTIDNFPVDLPFHVISLPTFADITGNGEIDILVGSENSFASINKRGELFMPSSGVGHPDSLYIAGGSIAMDINDDGTKEVISTLSRNRLGVWENVNNNEFRLNRHYPVSFSEGSMTIPTVAFYADEMDSQEKPYLFVNAKNGKLFRQPLPPSFSYKPGWHFEYGNLNRTSFYDFPESHNTFETDKLIVRNQTYVYPNPYSTINNSTIFKGNQTNFAINIRVMTSADTSVEISVYDIAGNRINRLSGYNSAYMEEVFTLDVRGLSSGVYVAQIRAGEEMIIRKFAIEK
jgi:M6 family metalloprotease-like protein